MVLCIEPRRFLDGCAAQARRAEMRSLYGQIFSQSLFQPTAGVALLLLAPSPKLARRDVMMHRMDRKHWQVIAKERTLRGAPAGACVHPPQIYLVAELRSSQSYGCQNTARPHG